MITNAFNSREELDYYCKRIDEFISSYIVMRSLVDESSLIYRVTQNYTYVTWFIKYKEKYFEKEVFRVETNNYGKRFSLYIPISNIYREVIRERYYHSLNKGLTKDSIHYEISMDTIEELQTELLFLCDHFIYG